MLGAERVGARGVRKGAGKGKEIAGCWLRGSSSTVREVRGECPGGGTCVGRRLPGRGVRRGEGGKGNMQGKWKTSEMGTGVDLYNYRVVNYLLPTRRPRPGQNTAMRTDTHWDAKDAIWVGHQGPYSGSVEVRSSWTEKCHSEERTREARG